MHWSCRVAFERQVEHSVRYPPAEALVIAELPEQLGIVLHEFDNHSAQGFVVLDAGVLLI